MHGLPGPAFDRLIEAMAEVIDYPDDPLRTFPTSDPYVRRVEFGEAGLITYLINDGASRAKQIADAFQKLETKITGRLSA
jgi:hypothetical protein